MKSIDLMFQDGVCHFEKNEVGACGPTEIKCKAIKSLISTGSEVIQFMAEADDASHRKAEYQVPLHPGYSMVAEVVEVGSEVKEYRVGDLVYNQSRHKQIFNMDIAEEHLQKLPEDISVDQAVWLTVLKGGMCCAMKSEIQPGQTAVVAGLGIFGQAAVQFLRIKGAGKIIAVDPNPARTELALKLGATHAVTDVLGNCTERIMEINEGRRPESVIDTTNEEDALRPACDLCINNGHVVLFSDPSMLREQCIGTHILTKYINIHGIYINMMMEKPNPFFPMTVKDFHKTIFQYIREGRLYSAEMITDVVSPMDCAKTLTMLHKDRGSHMGVVYDWKLCGEAKE